MKNKTLYNLLFASIISFIACDIESIEESAADSIIVENDHMCDDELCNVELTSSQDLNIVNESEPQAGGATMCHGNSYDLCITHATTLSVNCEWQCNSASGPCQHPRCLFEGSASFNDNVDNDGSCTTSNYPLLLFTCGGCRAWVPNAGPNMEGAWEEKGFTLVSGTCGNGIARCDYQLHDCRDSSGAKELPDCSGVSPCGYADHCEDFYTGCIYSTCC